MKLKKLVSVVLATAMIASMGSFAAMAATETDATAMITKQLETSKGVTLQQDMEFDFTFEAVDAADYTVSTSDGKSETAKSENNTPAISSKSVKISKDATATPDASTGKNIYRGNTGNVLAGIDLKTTFKHAGVYAYKVVETGFNPAKGEMTNSKAEYQMLVVIANKAGSDDLYVQNIFAKKTKNDDETKGSGDKVKITTDDITNEFKFINTYNKSGNEDTENGDSLVIDKTVKGAMGDKTQDFTFTINITKAPTSKVTSYSYKKVDANGNEIAAKDGETFKVEAGTDKTFTLKHGEKIKFDKTLTAGTTYSLTEANANGYTTAYSSISNGATDSVNNANNILVGEKANSTSVTNTYKDVTPTGIIINNLPYILMGLLAACGAAMYLFLKRRHEENI